ncbi:dihydrolipoamide acetyltransferase family protein [Microbacterium oxydans]|jgi:pyruvate dehydrogenase E2 component (dihydrolipoamide acetyltransferase)|uniref:Dihydrolipoamide acetyltransferase component of pyruvate dehydrogenase complex n=3 Tax=Microbacterium TaxID=33882 RepID=A0A147DW32_9MICO|nr:MULTISPECIES: dihydrolipoamide acetyltransferase family protein [Microbacterium]AZS42227.1 Dihydrolipoyllysine-residue acetyltransferase component of pyruvate dehydrogenase complex [Microbacterium oxydans]KAB1892943.1 2-oxo acid dehydrogenase subunit E2 [Microbacterium oxydans]KTR74795.1 branched-chain alpha-keto acid dehydrogenase subunit E2 [Microbacterium oxydans]MBE7952794.1 2-oxo acid dehydrogenase subunit E2 [Microbacterium sp. R1]NYF26608.1 pyruvate dehydrogenase E2 component (dihydr
MSTQNFTLPDVGEGLTEAEIVAWKVAPGDTVAINDVVCEIETAKSLVELPSPYAGVVGELLAAEGTTVEVGTPIITFLTEPAAGTAAAPAPAAPAAEEGGGSVLVGYGTGGGATSRRKRPAERPVRSSVGVIAKPPIRKLARDLGVDLTAVAATGADGEVTRDDVMKHASQASVFRNIETPEWGTVREETVPAPQAAPAGLARGLTATRPSAAGDDRTESIPVKGVRKATSSAMVQSAYSAPHVTVWKEIDATRTMDLVKRLKASPDYADIKVSPLLIMARAVIWAARRTPMVNAAWIETESGAEIAVRHYVNLGIAAATPRGLLVPNIKDAQDLSMKELARALNRLTLTARDGKTPPADQQGGTITITNIGVFGMDAGTPIINPGEAGIVAMGTISQKPWVVDGEVRPRWVTTVAGSFDHRVIDGDGMSRFIADVASILEEPALLVD